MFMLGYAYQRGLIPVSSSGIEQAITLNGIAVESNIQTFRWGRRATLDIEAVSDLAYGKPTSRKFSGSVQRDTKTYTWPIAKTPSKQPRTRCFMDSAWVLCTVSE